MWSWLIGLVISLPVGAWATGVFLHKLRRYTRLPKIDHDPATLPVPSWLTGIVERLFFMIVVASVGATAAGGMVGWLALKMAANWNRSSGDGLEGQTRRARGAISALLAGLVSMMFALLGGLVIHGRQP
jgi:hypothetical protein